MTFSLYFYPSKKFWNSNTETHIDSNQMALKSCLFIRFVSCVISLQANSFRFQHNMLTFAAHRTCQIDLFYKFSLARLILLMKVPKINPKRNRFGFDVSGKLHVFFWFILLLLRSLLKMFTRIWYDFTLESAFLFLPDDENVIREYENRRTKKGWHILSHQLHVHNVVHRRVHKHTHSHTHTHANA